MIVDRIEYLADYTPQLPHLAAAIKFMKSHPSLPEGKHHFEGGYIMEQEMMSRPLSDDLHESHKQYIDVQILLEGTEVILWNRTENMTQIGAYDEEKDKYLLAGKSSPILLTPGMFCVMFPYDAHGPCRYLDGDSPIRFRKHVLKLEVD